MKIHYNPKLKQFARELRKNSTLAEVLLWQRLRNKQFHGLDFHRQKPIDEYVVDFFCPKLKLVIEVDGHSHDLKQAEDEKRQSRLEALGFMVVRLLDSDVKTNLDGVLKALEKKFELARKAGR
ncbi:MAG: endonuclease domain-containing protein [Candidatus Glassbacteria bacterium]|nr:endonuclease domain-containing protein [Candidatus Glassbacteria bacterium]